MADKLSWRNNGTWALITLGLAMIGYWLVLWLFAASRARAGGLDLDGMAARTTLSLKGVVVGIVIVAIGVVARWILKPRRQPAP